MSAVVRPAVAEDEPALYQMASEAAGSPLDRELFDALLHRGLADPTHRVALAFLQGEPAGWGELEIGYTLAENGLTGTVVQLYVRPAQREKGVGRALLIHLAAAARRKGCGRLLANCSRVNMRSRAFLERNGFVLGKAQFEFHLPQDG